MSDLVRTLQRRVGVAADGIYGPATHAAVMAALDRAGPAPDHPRVNARGIALLHHFESCRLTAYKCPAGVWTIGWGNTFYANGKPVQPGDTITQATADQLFRTVLARFELGVHKLLAGAPTTPNQFAALVSFAYNVGLDDDADTRAEGLGDSTLLRLHRAGNTAGAAAEFGKWINKGSAFERGLRRRREAEAMLYRDQLASFDLAIGYQP